MTPQIQKIREVCSALVEAQQYATPGHLYLDRDFPEIKLEAAPHGVIILGSFFSRPDAQFHLLAANTSANLARSLMIAVRSLCEIQAHAEENIETCAYAVTAEQTLRQIASQLTGDE